MKVVVGIDFSEHSRRALEAAMRLAQDMGASLVLVHAFAKAPLGVPREGPMDPVSQVKQEGTLHDAMEVSEQWAQKARAAGLDVEVLAEEGKPADLVAKACKDRRAALVVVGTHGRTGLRRAVLGSVADAIVRQSKVPVVVVP